MAGYKVYYGQASGIYTNSIDVGNATRCIVSGLDEGKTYFFVAKAYSNSGEESDFSSEISSFINSAGISTDPPPSSAGEGGGCFIATAAYGSYMEPEVQVLRDFRDTYLLKSLAGQAFVNFYYQTSPPVADYIREHEAFRAFIRWSLTPVVYAIRYPFVLVIIIAGLLSLTCIRKVKNTRKYTLRR